ncbi:MAG: outer membrane beta-barrel protein [Holosporales bacterium]|jgi:opacity protein-like surface antigen|nr:outer membrane beta-barrel protein [Holosporales bacterium]
MINKAKYLTSSVVALAALPSAQAANCSPGGFYVGAAIGANFGKATVQVDKENLKKKAAACVEPLVAKLNESVKAVAAQEKPLEDQVTAIGKVIEDAVDAYYHCVQQLVRQVAFPAPANGGGYPIGSLLAILNAPANAGAENQWIVGAIRLLVQADPTLEQSELLLADPDDPAGVAGNPAADRLFRRYERDDLTGLFKTAVTNLIKEGKLATLLEDIPQQTLFDDFHINAGNPAVPIVTFEEELSEDYKDKAVAAVKPYLDSVEARTRLITTYRDAVKDSTDPAILTIFYKAADKKEALTDAAVIATNLTNFGTKSLDSAFATLGFSNSNQISKKATGFGFGFIAGFDHRTCDAMLGIELEAEVCAGGKIKIRDSANKTGSDGITVSRQWGVSLKPRVGYMFAPQVEVYFTVGAGFNKYKVDTSALKAILEPAAGLKKIADAYNAKNAKTPIDTQVFDSTMGKILKAHSKTKFTPIVGAGVRYQVTSDIDLLVEYNYGFKTNIVDTAKAGAKIGYEYHKLKAGAVFRVN